MKLIIFDFDGTLVDSRKLILESHRIIFGEFELPLPTPEASLALIGRSLSLVLGELAGPDAPVDQMTAAYDRLLPQLRTDAGFAEAPFDGAGGLLGDLAARDGVRLAIATGHVSQAIMPALAHLGWQKFFCNIQTADRAPSKPHPGMLLQALGETGTSAANAVMIGDTAFDMEMAVAAGVQAVGVSWGYHTPERLGAAGAAYVAGNLRELQDYLSVPN